MSRPPDEQRDQLVAHPKVPTVRPLDPDKRGTALIRQVQDRLYLAPGETAVVNISATVNGAPVDATILRADLVRLEGTPPTASAPIASVAFRDDGSPPDESAGDRVTTATVQPPESAVRGFKGDLRLLVTLEAGGERGTVAFSFVYTGEPPARFTGSARDTVEDGSLAIYVGIEVFRPGRYVLVGRLFDSHDRPIAILQFNDLVSATARELRLLGFGKLLRDESAEGAFTLRDLQGWRMVEVGFPDREMIEMWPGPYRTAAYSTAVFTDQEWDSASKRRHLESLQQAVDSQQH